MFDIDFRLAYLNYGYLFRKINKLIYFFDIIYNFKYILIIIILSKIILI